MKVVITGGAGFIGSNAAAYYLKKGHEVLVFDSLVRPGSQKNLRWLESLKKKLLVVRGDVRNLPGYTGGLPQMPPYFSFL